MLRLGFLLLGFASLGLAVVGAFLPLLPTVPFIILAAYCFARSSPTLERRLCEHPVMGPHVLAWRERGAISRRGKRAAYLAFVVSAAIGLAALDLPWNLLPLLAALAGGMWIRTRPEA